MELIVKKAQGGCLIPVDLAGEEYLAKKKLDTGFKVNITEYRNVAFHRKYFALLNYAYEAWEPQEKTFMGEIVQKNFDQFRADITVLAGYYTTSYDINGNLKFSPKSISFGRMGQEEFEKLYNATIDVLLRLVLKGYDRDEVDRVVNNILSFT